MSVPFLDLVRETATFRDRIETAVQRVLDSGNFVLGPEVERFEEEFASYCGAQHAIGVGSGTDAIAIGLRAAGVESGDEVVAPANTCVPTIAGIEQAGAVPVLADVDEHTRTLDPASLDQAIGNRTRAVVAVHLYGRLAAMDAIGAIARNRGLIVLEDAAQAHGAIQAGRRAGTLGDVAAFSFYPTKNLGALGDAGAVVTSDTAIAERARRLRVYGERRRDESVESGWNSRLDPVQAAVLRAKLPSLDARNERRTLLACRYHKLLEGVNGIALPEAAAEADAHHLFVVRVGRRDELRARLDERGIGTLVHYPVPVHRHPAYVALAGGPVPLAVTERLADEVLSLPLYPELEDAELDEVTVALRALLP